MHLQSGSGQLKCYEGMYIHTYCTYILYIHSNFIITEQHDSTHRHLHQKKRPFQKCWLFPSKVFHLSQDTKKDISTIRDAFSVDKLIPSKTLC